MHFLKKLAMPRMATPTELSEVHARIDAQMQGLTQKWALESLGIDRLLPLINIADHEKLGVTKAVLYAYRFGYLAGKKRKQEGDGLKKSGKEFWKQSIIEVIDKIDSETSLMKIYYFVIVFLR